METSTAACSGSNLSPNGEGAAEHDGSNTQVVGYAQRYENRHDDDHPRNSRRTYWNTTTIVALVAEVRLLIQVSQDRSNRRGIERHDLYRKRDQLIRARGNSA